MPTVGFYRVLLKLLGMHRAFRIRGTCVLLSDLYFGSLRMVLRYGKGIFILVINENCSL